MTSPAESTIETALRLAVAGSEALAPIPLKVTAPKLASGSGLEPPAEGASSIHSAEDPGPP